MYIDRRLARELKDLAGSPIGRGIILTGARQTGKTTLLRREFEQDYEYHSFDEILTRESIVRRPATDWIRQGGSYIFDEVQKAPEFLGTVKVILDEGPETQRVILSGSAQIQLLSGIHETLAGRVVTRELFPLGAAEIAGREPAILLDLFACTTARQVQEVVKDVSFRGLEDLAPAREALDGLLSIGGMPALLRLEKPSHRWTWVEEYCQSYLQRDLSDLGRIGDLDDFVRLERIAASRTATTINYSDFARDADLSPVTAKKYLRYLDLSYQTFRLEAHRGRRGGRMIKAPRLHWTDLGIQRVLSRLRSGLTGQQYESLICAEIHKLVRTLRLDIDLTYLRTKDGREVDLLTRLPSGGYLAWEMKASRRAAAVDARHLRGLQDLLDGPLLGGFVVYRGHEVQSWPGNLHAMPAASLLG